jgi:hypothetical protein
VEAFKCRGNDEEDHHSRNLRRNMDVGRIKVNDDVSVGRRVVRKKVNGERVKEVFPAKDFDGGGVYVNIFFHEGYRIMWTQSLHPYSHHFE